VRTISWQEWSNRLSGIPRGFIYFVSRRAERNPPPLPPSRRSSLAGGEQSILKLLACSLVTLYSSSVFQGNRIEAILQTQIFVFLYFCNLIFDISYFVRNLNFENLRSVKFVAKIYD